MTLVDIGKALKLARIARDMSQDRVSRMTGMKAPNISQVERGLRPHVRYDTLRRYAEAVGLELVLRELPHE